MEISRGALALKTLLLLIAAFVAAMLILFVPAGTPDYWQAWLYLAVLFIPFFFVAIYLLIRSPELIVRRMRYEEKEKEQKRVISVANAIFIIGLLIPGLDHRFGWSEVPFEAVIAADLLVLIGYGITALSLKENPFASRTVGVDKRQMVISTGLYSVVRHPMYAGSIILYLATPVALGSCWAVLPFLALPVILFYRIRGEEALLRKKLAGYSQYCEKVRYRLVPLVW